MSVPPYFGFSTVFFIVVPSSFFRFSVTTSFPEGVVVGVRLLGVTVGVVAGFVADVVGVVADVVGVSAVPQDVSNMDITKKQLTTSNIILFFTRPSFLIEQRWTYMLYFTKTYCLPVISYLRSWSTQE